jgi:hypothetical protein
MSKFKILSLSEADLNRLEKASDKGASAAKEIRGLKQEIIDAGDHGIAEVTELHEEMDGHLFGIFTSLVGSSLPSQQDRYKGMKVAIVKASEGSKQYMVWDIDADAVFANEKFKSIAEAKAFAKQNGMTVARVEEPEVAKKAKTHATATTAAPKAKATAKVKKPTGPLRGNAAKQAEMRQKREDMLARTLSRKDLQELTPEQVLTIARQYNDLRMNVGKDLTTASKERIDPSPANLIRWMRHPGSFDLIGIDSARATTATANLKISVGEWFKRYTGG